MRPAGLFKALAVCLAVTGFCMPQPLFAAGGPNRPAGLMDVELRDGGVLFGQVVDQQGVPLADVSVTLLNGEQKLAETQTDARGVFAFQRLRGGVCQVTAAEGIGAYRVWAPGTAPPSAEPGALLVAGTDLVRGNMGAALNDCGCWMRYHLSNPLVLAGLTATAIAVPIALHNQGKHTPVSPP